MATTKKKLLTQNERELCEKIAELNIVLVSRRAQALLLRDDGQTQIKSSEGSSLTIGQLRYLLRLFKKKRLNVFPEQLIAQIRREQEEEKAPLTELTAEPEAELEAELEVEGEAEPETESAAEPELKADSSRKATKKEKKKKKKKKKEEEKTSTKKKKKKKRKKEQKKQITPLEEKKEKKKKKKKKKK